MDDELKAANDIYMIASALPHLRRERVMAWVVSRLKEDYVASLCSGITYENDSLDAEEDGPWNWQ